MKKIVSAGEIVVEIMADRLDQSLAEPGLLHGPFHPERRRSLLAMLRDWASRRA